MRSLKDFMARQFMKRCLGLSSGVVKGVVEALAGTWGKVKPLSGAGLALRGLKSLVNADQQPRAGASLSQSSELSQLPAVTMTGPAAAPLKGVGMVVLVACRPSTCVSGVALSAGIASTAELAACCCWVAFSTNHARKSSLKPALTLLATQGVLTTGAACIVGYLQAMGWVRQRGSCSVSGGEGH